MRVTVDYVNAPKAGQKNGSIKAGDNYYYYDPKKFTFVKGESYDIEFREEEYKGKTYAFVESAKGKSTGASGERWYMPFVSNIVAHAISSGRIEDASQILIWAKAAKAAAMALEEDEDGGDDLPFN